MPLMQLKMLVLPAPLGPMMAWNSPAVTSRLTPASAATPPKFRCSPCRLSKVIAGIDMWFGNLSRASRTHRRPNEWSYQVGGRYSKVEHLSSNSRLGDDHERA